MTTAIIPNWNGRQLLDRILPALREQSEPFTRIVVVDNGSTDGSQEAARRLGAEVIAFDANRGFAAAVNAGVNSAGTDLVAILNNDVRLDLDWHRTLARKMAECGAGYVTGKILQENNPDRIDGTFDCISRAGCAWRCGSDRPDGPLWNQSRRVSMIPLTAALIQRSVWQAVGGLDERFESYLEDVDFGIRAASQGYTGLYEPAALAWHQGSATRGAWHPRTIRQISRNQLYLIAKHLSSESILRNGWRIAVGQVGWGLVALQHRCGSAYWKGKLEGIVRFASMRDQRCYVSEELFRSSEQELLELQRRTGMERYWRFYALLTRA